MLLPSIYLWQCRKQVVNESLVALDGYEYPAEQNANVGSSADLEDCMDSADGTINF
jgi:hypothetical protein